MILWNENSISILFEILEYFKKHLGVCLEQLADFYMDRYSLILDISKYSMGISEETLDPEVITAGIYKLAFICDLNYYLNSMETNQYPKQHAVDSETIYKYIEKMIKYCIREIFDFPSGRLKNNEFYLLSIIKDALILDEKEVKYEKIKIKNKIKIRKNKYLDLISIAYFLVVELMKKEKTLSIYEMKNMLTYAQTLDLTILNKEEIKAITEIFKTKRKIFVRILLILSNEILKYEYTENKLMSQLKFKNREEMVYCLSNPIIETIIYLISCNIIENNEPY